MKLTYGKALTVAIATALAMNAMAADGDPHDALRTSVQAAMRIMDTNQDGRISAAEHATGARQMFKGMDSNRDERVTAAEMDAAHRTMQAAGHGQTDIKPSAEKSTVEKIRAVDADGDGSLTAQEHAAGSQQMFAKMDTDADGFLTSAELEAGHTRMLSASDR